MKHGTHPAGRHAFPPATGVCALPAAAIVAGIRAREFSVREVAAAFLDRIDAVNPLVNAVVSLRPREDILAEADGLDGRAAAGDAAGALFGLPVAVKDLALTKGLRTTFGSPLFADHVPDEDEFFVARMRAAGAILIGKTNTSEWGLGSHTFNPVFGPTRNALDPALTAGGSSGGAAVAAALGMVPLADGSDFGGSLRNPAAFNNIYGFRPSQGLVPGGPATEVFLSQMGVEGPMGRRVADLALLLSVQAGFDPRAPLSLDGVRIEPAPKIPGERRLKLGWLGDWGGTLPTEKGVIAVCEQALAAAGEDLFHVEPLAPAFPFEALWQAFVRLRQATTGASLKLLADDPAKREGLKPEAIWEAEEAARLGAAEVYAASVTRTVWHARLLALFERFDLLALPSAQVFAFPVEQRWPAEIAGRAMRSYHEWMAVSAPATLGGCPAVSVPAGFDARGRAMGLQLIGRPRADNEVLSAAAGWEAIRPWPAGA